jgi:hypothetical protein
MDIRIRFPTPCCAAVLATCSVLALSMALAAEKPFPVGTYAAEGQKLTIAFDDKGEFRVTQGETLQVTGQYAAKEGQLQITDKQGPWACTKAGEQTGTYRWKYENSVLTFRKVADHCDDRVQSLTSAKWTQKS